LASCTVLENKVEVVVIFIVIVKLHNMFMVQSIHYFDFQLDLIHQIIFYDFGLVDDFDGVDVL
jgi:hypothetical protein